MRRTVLWGAVCALLCPMFVLAATPEKRSAETLRALPGVYFVVEELGGDLQSNGLTAEQIRSDLESQLRQAGVRLLTESQWAETPGKPFLYIRVSSAKTGSRIAYHLKLELFQRVRLERYQDMPPVQVPTWGADEEIGVIDANRVQEIRTYVRELMSEFIRTYLALNTV